MNKVIIYRDQLLPSSNTFVYQQAKFLNQFSPIFCGSKKEMGIDVGLFENYIANQGGLMGYFDELKFKLFSSVPSYVKQLKKDKNIKLVHAHFGPDAMLGSIVSRALNIPLISTFHGYEVTVRPEILKGMSWRDKNFVKNWSDLNQHGQKFIAVSKYMEKKLIDYGFEPNKIIQHYIGIDTNEFRQNASIPKENIVLFVGRLTEKKGLKYLIDAMEIVQKKLKLKLVIIGDGELRVSLEANAKQKLEDYHFLGVQSSIVVKEWLHKSSIFCVPSIIASNGDAETFGIVFAEAQAMGVPVVSFMSGGIPEVVLHHETGFLAQEKNVQELAEYIVELQSNKDIWNRFSKNGIENVNSNFDILKQTIKLEEIYNEVIG